MTYPNQKPKTTKVLRASARWQDLRIYQKADTMYQLTVVFCRRFLPPYGDRTVDQMVQAARSGKQNIVEGSEDGKTSTEMEIKLINVARSSIGELREDYLDHMKSHHLALWNEKHHRYLQMQEYTKAHNKAEDFMMFAEKWTEEEYCNTCLTLCYQLDAMINKYLNKLQEIFTKEGGIKERMYAARTGYRKGQDEKMKALESENAALKTLNSSLKAENDKLKSEASLWKDKYKDLRERALNAYYRLQAELEVERAKHQKQEL